MKKYLANHTILKRLSLLALMSIPHSYILSAVSGVSLINFSGSVALREEQHISNFFDKNDPHSWDYFVEEFKKEIIQLTQKINEITRAPGDILLGDAVDFAHYIIQQFNAIIYVFEKHNGKNNVNAFQSDVEALNFENTFIVCKAKLEIMKTKAEKDGNSEAVEAIGKLIRAIEIKRKKWSDKLNKKMEKLALLTAITKRMAIK